MGADLGVTVLTNIPSPYQVDLFNAVACESGYSLSVIYVSQSGKSRKWDLQDIRHSHCYLNDDDGWHAAENWVRTADLVVYSGYRGSFVRKLIKVRTSLHRPWAFWGERPGFRFPGFIGRAYRKLVLMDLHRSKVPVWGIGQWGLDGYQRELGNDRLYINMPYYSDLTPFFNIDRLSSNGPLKFLFSGQFILRKGIDLLIVAFDNLLKEGIDAELHLVGGGTLEGALKQKTSEYRSRIFFHGFKQPHELAEVYSKADILCAPSRHDGWGLIVPEGLAAGMPVISTNRTGSARELIDGKNGWLVQADNMNSLFLAMKSAAGKDTGQLLEMTHYARESAKRQHINKGVSQFKRAVEVTLKVEMAAERSG